MPNVVISLTALIVVIVTMLGELRLSLRHERLLLGRGAVWAPDPVYGTMRWAYPVLFVLMAAEGALRGAGYVGWPGTGPGWWTWAGAATLLAGKVIKYWAVATLGERWTYRVLVLPGAPLIARGPYRFMRHPNYVGVVGELVGMAMLTSAWFSGPIAVITFGEILRRRILAENRALGYPPSAAQRS